MNKNKVTFILHKPQLSENIGACARAIKNFNFQKLYLIDPKPIFPNDKILATSVGAKDIIKKSKVFNNLESSLPSDTIKVATYVNKKYSTKKIYFYVCSFTESTQRANHQEIYSLFSIMWSRDSLWELNPWYCCSVLSEEPQAPLHKEAANWMFKGVATTGCLIASVAVSYTHLTLPTKQMV